MQFSGKNSTGCSWRLDSLPCSYFEKKRSISLGVWAASWDENWKWPVTSLGGHRHKSLVQSLPLEDMVIGPLVLSLVSIDYNTTPWGQEVVVSTQLAISFVKRKLFKGRGRLDPSRAPTAGCYIYSRIPIYTGSFLLKLAGTIYMNSSSVLPSSGLHFTGASFLFC